MVSRAEFFGRHSKPSQDFLPKSSSQNRAELSFSSDPTLVIILSLHKEIHFFSILNFYLGECFAPKFLALLFTGKVLNFKFKTEIISCIFYGWNLTRNGVLMPESVTSSKNSQHTTSKTTLPILHTDQKMVFCIF